LILKSKIALIIDDDQDESHILKLAIESQYPDIEVIIINDSLDVVSRLKELPISPSYVFLDLQMPIKDGRAVLRDLSSLPYFQQLQIGIVTGLTNPNLLTQFREELTGYILIEKPTTYLEIVKSIQRFFDHQSHNGEKKQED
jgi:response regulator RpfG family c-di-GMP phosphodiesterase